MPHEAETSLEGRIEALLVDRYGRSAVHRQFVWPTTQRRVDLLLDVGFARFAIECESRPEEIIDGLGQVMHYAAHDWRSRVVPMIVVADGHELESPEQHLAERQCMVYTESELQGALANPDPDPED